LSREDVLEVLNTLKTLYPRMFSDLNNQETANRYIKLYTRYLGDLKLQDVLTGIDKYVLSDDGKYAPGINEIVTNAKNARSIRMRGETNGKRIVTPEEVAADLFHKEMAKPHEKRDYKLLDMTKFYAAMFTDDEEGRTNYKKHFGKTREEFESY